MRITIPLTISIAAIIVAAACGGAPPPPVVPVVDSTAVRDSIAREEATRRATADSSRRAREEAERITAERRADSLAVVARETERVRSMFATRIHFDFDRADIRSEDRATLDMKIAIMQANPALRITITGHCDERGSDEYNIALGNRRALAAREYMVSRGISADRVMSASRGEEDPVDAGHTDMAWEQNRRDEFSLSAGGQQLRAPSGM